MKYILKILLSLTVISTFGQNKGVTPVANSKETESVSTYAVVVGISDYQDPAIPDLRFADKDAEAFANFLRSNAGGNLDEDHLKILINSEATMAQFAILLDWLMENVKEGDQAIIYFSGHGDVEKKTLTQPGFLLCWDAPARVYMAGGAFALPMLQEVVSTLSIQNKAKVIVITDACRSGNLAGQSIGGAQATAGNIAKQYANEIKILSCQPNEYSIEGEQWGGGRGAFSFNLVDALYGMADGNNDLFITLQEVGRYLEDHVTAEVAPVSQVPMVIGNRTELLASVDAKLLADLRAGKTSQMAMLSQVESRGIEDYVLAEVDTTTQELYFMFNTALKDKVFLEPAGACAEVYYARLMAEPKLARLHSTMTRNYAAALQDDAQQVLNIMLKSGLTSEVLSAAKVAYIYRNYPAYLDRAAELLGSGHYMYVALKARKHYFTGTLQTEKLEKKKQFFEALQWQADMPHAYVALIDLYPPEQADSAEYYAAKAVQIVQSWVKPYVSLSHFYQKAEQPDKAEQMLNRASQVDSNSILVWYEKAAFYLRQKKYDVAEYWYFKSIAGSGADICFPCAHNDLGIVYHDNRRNAEAEEQFKKAIQLDSTFANAYLNLGRLYADNMNRYAEAEQQYQKAIQLDSTDYLSYYNLGVMYRHTRRFDLAETEFKKAIQLDSNNKSTFLELGLVYDNTGRYELSEVCYKKAIQLDSSYAKAHINLGIVYSNSGRLAEAEEQYKKAIQLDSTQAHAYISLGALYYNDYGRYAEAEDQFKKAIQLGSTHAVTYSNLGNVYSITGRYADAERQYKKAIQLDSTYLSAYRNLGSTYHDAGRYDEAEQQFKKVLQLKSTDALACINLASLKGRQNLTDEAFDYLEKALRNGFSNLDAIYRDSFLAPLREQRDRWESMMQNIFVPDSADAKGWNLLGQLYIQVREYPSAELAFIKAVKIDDLSATYRSNLGFVYLNLGRYPEAEVALKKAIALDSVFANPRKHLGMVYFKTNRPEKARQNFLKALEINPNYSAALLGMAYVLTTEGKNAEAITYVEESINKGSTYEQLEKDEDLNSLLSTPECMALMKKYFPNQYKE